MFALRSLFIRLYGVSAFAVTLLAVYHLSQLHWQWLAPLLAWAPLTTINLLVRRSRNFAFRDDRERPAMMLTLLGVALALVTDQRELTLWLTLSGLFGLLIFLFIASSLPMGIREQEVEERLMGGLGFVDRDSNEVPVTALQAQGDLLLVFMHSPSQIYSRMALREIETLLLSGQLPLAARQIAVVFPGTIPPWAQSISAQGVQLLADPEGDALASLGLWLRGGNWLFAGGQHACRPALAVLKQSDQKPVLWRQASNFRLPPSVLEQLPKINKLLESSKGLEQRS